MTASPLRGYAAQIKIVLVLLVLFLAVAIYFNIHLLRVARNAILDEVSERLALEADLARVELERDQMLRGLSAGTAASLYIPPTFLDRVARLKGMRSIEILALDGRIISSSDASRVGREDGYLRGRGEAGRRRLLAGGSVVTPLEREGFAPHATLAAYRPIQDGRRATFALIRVEEDVPILASVDLNLRTISALQAGGLAFLLILVVLFARWLLQPYRRLAAAAGALPGAVREPESAAAREEPDYLVAAFQGVLDKLREQEREVQRLKEEKGEAPGGSPLPGDRLIRGMTSAALVFDRDGRLAALNAPAEALVGVMRGAALGRSFADLLAANGRLSDLVGRSLRTGESHSREVVPLAGPSGRVAHLGAMISPILGEAEPGGSAAIQGVICLLADLTEIKALRERVGLKENLAALGEMSAGIAHEFRNALAAIQGFARLIARNGGGAGPAREHAETILREVEDVEKVVDDFLRYARPKSLDLSEVDLRALVENLAAEFRADPRSARIALDLQGAFPSIVGDETLIRQALQNLLRNAAESFGVAGAPPGAGTPEEAPQPRIVIRGLVDGGPQGGARIEVEDNGPGIPPEDLGRIFTPFFTTKDRGTGLGLALAQKTAVLHDGRVEVLSTEGRGSRFALVIPARPGASAPAGSLS